MNTSLSLFEAAEIESWLVANKELAVRLIADSMASSAENINTFDQVLWFRSVLGFNEDERFAVIFADHGGKILGKELLAEGTKTRCVIYPRKLFGRALELGATHMVICHNHPGQNCVPSIQDRELTRRIADIGASLEVTLLDHVIITRTQHYSFKENGSL